MSTKITLEILQQDGWEATGDSTAPYQKKLENLNPLNASEDSDIKLSVHYMYNAEIFAVVFPDGGLLNFSASTMEELKAFETAIQFYDPPF